MLNAVDSFLNRITMYRLVLYGLFGLAIVATVCASLSKEGLWPGSLPEFWFSPYGLMGSLVTLLLVSVFLNFAIARSLGVSVNSESQFITALILFFLLPPAENAMDYGVLASAAALSVFAKYVLVVRGKHVFNPAAAAAVGISLFGLGGALWWVGMPVLAPFTIVLGVLVLRKLRRTSLAVAFIAASLVGGIIASVLNNLDVPAVLSMLYISGPAVFLLGIMVTEPLTMPPSKKGHILYGGLIGFLCGVSPALGAYGMTPEMSLLVGNAAAFALAPMGRMQLIFTEKRKLAENLYEFVFSPESPVSFMPGQYAEWTLTHRSADTRGMRRYFTIASSPLERDVKLGLRIESANSSSFKQALMKLAPGTRVSATNIAGDFTLPPDPATPLAFIAGGIGVTPFRSMVSYLVEKGEKRDIVFYYANRADAEIAYRDLFDQAAAVGVKMVYVANTATDPAWKGYTGYLTKEIIQKESPDYADRVFYISGSHGMVTAFTKTLGELGVPRTNIHTDYFPGFA